MVYIIEDNTVIWTRDIYNKYTFHEDAFISFHECKKEIDENLSNGVVMPRVNVEMGDRYFKIMHEDKFVGELIVYHWADENYDEVSVFVFDEYANNKFGTKAMQQYIAKFHDRNHGLLVRVDTTNRLRLKIDAMLTNMDFFYDENMEGYIYNGLLDEK
ncbi:MAG: hypothetical protein J6N51_09765 [Selenomonas sp.]|nr:hypothetical protein [Selenomonas sp.]